MILIVMIGAYFFFIFKYFNQCWS